MARFQTLAFAAWLAVAWNPNIPVVVPGGFMTGNDYLQRLNPEQHGYVMGLMDGLFMSPALGADEGAVQRLKTCVLPMNSAQVKAIFDKYLRDNPQIWHQEAKLLFWQAILAACPSVIPH